MFSATFFFSSLLVLLSAAAPNPASDKPKPNHPSAAQHAERDLSLPLTLDNVTSANALPSSLNTTYALDLSCYHDDPQTPFRFIQPLDCHTALYTILLSPNAMYLRRWNRDSDLPVEYAHGSCSIILARASASSNGMFQEVLIARAAALLVESCVTARWRYQGGTTRIGTRGGFVVYVNPYRPVDG